MEDFNPNRYAVINEKNPREIVMLRGLAVLGDGAASATTILIFPQTAAQILP